MTFINLRYNACWLAGVKTYMARARAINGVKPYAVSIEAGGFPLAADEPASNGGGGTAPAPYDLLLASLSACTAITLRMYAERKNFPLANVSVDLHFTRDANKAEQIARRLYLTGDLTPEQITRLADVAEHTPVTLTLKRGLKIETQVMV